MNAIIYSKYASPVPCTEGRIISGKIIPLTSLDQSSLYNRSEPSEREHAQNVLLSYALFSGLPWELAYTTTLLFFMGNIP